MNIKNRKSEERTNLRDRFWPGAMAWTGEDSKGWFRAPRTFPLLLTLIFNHVAGLVRFLRDVERKG